MSTMIPARLSLVTLGAQDLPRLRAFYEAMGWLPRPGSDDAFASFLLGGIILALYPRELLRAEAAPDLASPAPGVWNGVTLAVNVDDREQVDDVFTRAVEAGARPVAPPRTASGVGAPVISPIRKRIAGRSPGHHGLVSTKQEPSSNPDPRGGSYEP